MTLTYKYFATLIFATGLSCVLNAQTRYCEITPVIVKPEKGHVFISPGHDQIQVAIINTGPDKLLASDKFGIGLNLGSIIGNLKFGSVENDIEVGDTFHYVTNYDLNFGGNSDSTPFCVYVTLYSTLDTLLFSDGKTISKVKNCITVKHADTLSTVYIPTKPDLITIWPNPSSGIFRISFGGSNVQVLNIYSSTGEMVFTQNSIDDKLLKVDLSNNLSGLYMAEVLLQSGQVIRKKLFIVD